MTTAELDDLRHQVELALERAKKPEDREFLRRNLERMNMAVPSGIPQYRGTTWEVID